MTTTPDLARLTEVWLALEAYADVTPVADARGVVALQIIATVQPYDPAADQGAESIASIDPYANPFAGLTDERLPTKTCARCHQTQPLDAFGRHAASRDGRGSYCRPCARIRGAAYRRRRKAKVPAKPVVVEQPLSSWLAPMPGRRISDEARQRMREGAAHSHAARRANGTAVEESPMP